MSEEHQLSDFVAGLTTTPGAGESNTASNTGSAGIGVFKQKVGVNLEFKKLNPASNRLSIVDDAVNSKIDLDVVTANLTGIPQSAVTNLTTDLAAKQAADADLTAIAGINSAVAGVIASDGAGWIHKTYAALKTALGLVKADVGLGNVDNTSDATKNAAIATLTNKTISGASNTITGLATGAFNNAAVTYAKLQNVSAVSRLLGRGSAGAGSPEEIVLGSGLQMSGTTLSTTSTAGAGQLEYKFTQAATLINQVQAVQFLANNPNQSTKLDLTNFTQARLVAYLATASSSANGPLIELRYNTVWDANPVNWISMGPVVSLAGPAGLIADIWVNLPAGAKADVFITITQEGGDGTADPALGAVVAQFR